MQLYNITIIINYYSYNKNNKFLKSYYKNFKSGSLIEILAGGLI